MAAAHGSKGHPLKGLDLNDPEQFLRALSDSPWAFDFFQALRRLECLHNDRPRLGEGQFPADESVRLSQRPSMRFAPSTIAGFQSSADDGPGRLEVEFLGMLGPQGPLPLHLTEYALRRSRAPHHDPTFASFLDVFNHRMLALFYRAWANALPTVNFDRPGPDSDRFGVFLASLIGYGETSLRERDALPDAARLHYAGRLAAQIRNAEGLQAVLADFFRLPVVVHEFIGQWLDLPAGELSLLGQRSCGLGSGLVAGSRVWDCQYKFRLVAGPLSLAEYYRLLPGGDSLRRLVAMVRSYLDDGLCWDLKLVLRREAVPHFELGGGNRLGWTTWLTRPADQHPALTRDGDDLCLDAMALAGDSPTDTRASGSLHSTPDRQSPVTESTDIERSEN